MVMGIATGLGAYAGYFLMYPLVGAFLVWLAIGKAMQKEDRLRAYGIAVQGGLVLWMILGAVIL